MKTGSLVAIPLALLVVGTALGQQPSAEDLFREGTLLFGRGETKAACDRFAASYKIDVAPGTLFNLAACHEKDGRLSDARAEFQEFIDRANKAGKADKAQPAIDHVAAIEARMSKLVLVFPAGSNVQSIVLDGALVDPTRWRGPMPVDAGSHTIELRAPGKANASKTVILASDGSTSTVDVPILTPEGAVSPVDGPPLTANVQPEIPASPPSNGSSKRTAGIVVASAGLVALGVGTAFGIVTLSEKSAANGDCMASGGTSTACPKGNDTTLANAELATARTSSWVSTVGLGVGVVAVGVGAYLFFTGGAHTEESTRMTTGVRVVPSFGRDGGGLSLAGVF
jgi:hypothetical protein